MPKIVVQGYDVRDAPVRRNVYALLLEFDPTIVAGPSARGSSYYKTLLSCPREFGLRHDAGLQPADPKEALTVGWLFHLCLQYYYQAIAEHQRTTPNRPSDPAWLWGGCNAGMKRAYDVLDVLRSAEGFGETADTLQRLVDSYFDRYDRQDRWRIIAVEETLYHHSLDYSARLDLLVHDLDRGGLFVTEHKTARVITEDLIANYQLDLQILGQVWLFLECVDQTKYPPFLGVRVNIATKHKTGAQTVRLDVCPSDSHLAAFERSIRDYKRLLPVMRELKWPQYFHCAGYSRGYSKCQFYDVCHDHPGRDVNYWRNADLPPDGFIVPDHDNPVVDEDPE